MLSYYTLGQCVFLSTQMKVCCKRLIYLFHPDREGAMPGVPLLQMQVGVKEDEVNVTLQELQANEQLLLTLLFCLLRFDLKTKNSEALFIYMWLYILLSKPQGVQFV